MKFKLIALIIFLTIFSSTLWADYTPLGNNGFVVKAKTPLGYVDTNVIYLSTSFSLGGYLDFGWIFISEMNLNSNVMGMALSLKGVVLSQSTTVPLNIELSGFYSFINADGVIRNYFAIESAYYREIDLDSFLLKLGPLFRYSDINNQNFSRLDGTVYFGGLFGLGWFIDPNLIFALDNRFLLNPQMQFSWEPEIVFAITLIN